MIIQAYIRASKLSAAKCELVLINESSSEPITIVPLTKGQAINMVWELLTGLLAHGA